jgi:hypothetical protein
VFFVTPSPFAPYEAGSQLADESSAFAEAHIKVAAVASEIAK